jgi:hypothetical protein
MAATQIFKVRPTAIPLVGAVVLVVEANPMPSMLNMAAEAEPEAGVTETTLDAKAVLVYSVVVVEVLAATTPVKR